MINEHVKNIYQEAELEELATIENNWIVQKEGKREVEREISFSCCSLSIYFCRFA